MATWDPLTHTVFVIPVELVPWMTLALIATHCVDANVLAPSIADAALIGVCGIKMAPCHNSTSRADYLSLEGEAVDKIYMVDSHFQGHVLDTCWLNMAQSPLA